jgi:hypothetical protein
MIANILVLALALAVLAFIGLPWFGYVLILIAGIAPALAGLRQSHATARLTARARLTAQRVRAHTRAAARARGKLNGAGA